MKQKLFTIFNISNRGHVSTWKQMGGSGGHIEVVYTGANSAKMFSSLAAARLFAVHLSFNNDDHCPASELRIVEFEESNLHQIYT